MIPVYVRIVPTCNVCNFYNRITYTNVYKNLSSLEQAESKSNRERKLLMKENKRDDDNKDRDEKKVQYIIIIISLVRKIQEG